MTRWTFCLCAIALALAGCAGWDANLDTRVYPGPAATLTPEEVQQLTMRARELRAQADRLRVQMVGETRRTVRMDQYRALHDLGEELAPLERRLAAGGHLPRAPKAGAS